MCMGMSGSAPMRNAADKPVKPSLAVALAGPSIPAALLVAVVWTLAVVVAVAAMSPPMAGAVVEDTWAAAGTRVAGICRGWTRRGFSVWAL